MGYKKVRSKRQSAMIIFSVLTVSAVAVFLAAFLFLHSIGFRYVTIERTDGEKVKFIGVADKSGRLYEGTVYFPGGSSARLSGGDTLTYADGNVYTGEMNELFLRDGVGKLTFKETGDIYVGEFINDVIYGRGEYRYANGDVYVGDFAGSVKHGEGTYTFLNGDKYTGGFEGDRFHGQGTYTWHSGASYTGGYSHGLKSGQGVFRYANGDSYSGTFKLDYRDGEGTYSWKNGESYQGQFKLNNINGVGTYRWADGKTYTGYFENGEIVIVEELPETPEISDTTE